MAIGYLFYNKVIVPDINDALKIYERGYFGKPYGIKKPKGEFKSPLELALVEALYLMEKGILKVRFNGKEMTYDELKDHSVRVIGNFLPNYIVYKDLRDNGLVVKSGIKFGADYAVYRIAPGKEHAPFLVEVLVENQKLSPSILISFGRVSHSVKKTLVLALVNEKTMSVKYITFKWEKS
jgi:tRNA-intron endonuclease